MVEMYHDIWAARHIGGKTYGLKGLVYAHARNDRPGWLITARVHDT